MEVDGWWMLGAFRTGPAQSDPASVHWALYWGTLVATAMSPPAVSQLPFSLQFPAVCGATTFVSSCRLGLCAPEVSAGLIVRFSRFEPKVRSLYTTFDSAQGKDPVQMSIGGMIRVRGSFPEVLASHRNCSA